MPEEPAEKRAVAFVDGQNLFHAAREAFGYSYPNYDVSALARSVCAANQWECVRVCFYTGIPEVTDNAFWHHFWVRKLGVMGTRGVRVFSRPLRYRNQTVRLADGATHTFLVGQEKGVDVRMALDIVRSVHEQACDVLLVFSQDQDLTDVAKEIRTIASQQDRWVKMASAFPFSPTTRNRRGIDRTDWIRIQREEYDQCIDPTDYRSKQRRRKS